MISCSHPSSHQCDRGQNLEAIICAGEWLCSAGLLLLHLLLGTQTVYWIWICWPPTPQQFSITLAPSPLSTWNTNVGALSQGSLSSNRLICLWLFPTDHSGYSLAVMQLSGSWRKPSRKPASLLPAHWPLSRSPSPLLTVDHWLYSLNLPST